MNQNTRRVVLALSVLLVCALPATAQSFEAEVDCGGEHVPGDVVPITARFENFTFEEIELTVDVEYRAPGIAPKTRQRPVTLGPNQDRAKTHQVILPDTAPEGTYRVTLTAMSETEMTFDTCNYKVRVRQ